MQVQVNWIENNARLWLNVREKIIWINVQTVILHEHVEGADQLTNL